jgi:hypothetical protein
MNRPHEDWPVFHFALSNPKGPEQGDVAALLRRVADSIEALGHIDVHDISFHSEISADGNDDLTMVVYYARPTESGK